MNKTNSAMSRSRGFTLLEALLGFMILSIGMLGIASLQAVSLKAGKTSVYGSVAMMKVDELLESMRINNSPAALAAYAAAGAGTGTDNGCTGATICPADLLAQEDIFWWKQNLKAGLPDSSLSTKVTLTAGAAPVITRVTVDVTWSERNKDATGSVSKTYTTTADICTAVPC